MARPKSDDKRDAILAAATSVFAEGGLTAPTSAISKGVRLRSKKEVRGKPQHIWDAYIKRASPAEPLPLAQGIPAIHSF